MTASDKAELTQRLQNMDDEQLVCMATTDRAQYRQETLELTEAEARRRGLDLHNSPISTEPESAGFGAAARSAVKAAKEAIGSQRFVAAGKPVVCSHCGCDLFQEQNVLLNTRGLTFFQLDWLDKGAFILVCTRCSQVLWFAKPASRA